jgi:hypothetical protein
VSDGLSTIVYGAEGVYSEQRSRTLPAPTCVLLEATYVEPGPEAERNGHMTGEQAGVLVSGRARGG